MPLCVMSWTRVHIEKGSIFEPLHYRRRVPSMRCTSIDFVTLAFESAGEATMHLHRMQQKSPGLYLEGEGAFPLTLCEEPDDGGAS